MTDFDALLSALPQAPDFAYDWGALARQPSLARWFEQMARTPQHPAWHGEGDVMTHTRLVCESLCGLEGFREAGETERSALALAALLHDIGKPACTRLEEGVLRSPRHGPVGSQMARETLWTEYGLSGETEKQCFREAVCLLIRYHTLPLHLFEKTDAETAALKTAAAGERAPAFTLRALCLLSEADVRGRISADIPQKLADIEKSRRIAREAGCLTRPYPFPSAVTKRKLFSGGSVWKDQTLYDDAFGDVILLSGLPGTGKDTWIAGHCPGLPVVSLDALRREMKASPRGDQGAVVQAAKEKAREYLRREQPFVWNATCLTAQNRAGLVRLFESYRARVRIVYLETAWAENLRRNGARKEKVPEGTLSDMLQKTEPPLPDEARAVEWICV